jgi:hypothetical protein
MNRLLALALASFVTSIPLAFSASFQCVGCEGQAGPIGATAAPAPCQGTAGTTFDDWLIEVSVVVFDGSCEPDGDADCSERPCQNEVTYSWGAEMPAGGIDVGAISSSDPLGAKMYYTFPGGVPWTTGQAGSITFPKGSSPGTACGNSTMFFIEAHMCGDQLATTTADCSECGNSPG